MSLTNNPSLQIDLSYLNEVADGNVEFIVEMIDIFLAQTPDTLKGLLNAIEQKNWNSISELSHKIKPTLGFIGVHSVREVMADIEMKAKKEIDYDWIYKEYTMMEEVFNTIYINLENTKKELV